MAEKPHKGFYRLARNYGPSGLLVVAGHVEEQSCCSILAVGLSILQQLHSVRYNIVSQHDCLCTYILKLRLGTYRHLFMEFDLASCSCRTGSNSRLL